MSDRWVEKLLLGMVRFTRMRRLATFHGDAVTQALQNVGNRPARLNKDTRVSIPLDSTTAIDAIHRIGTQARYRAIRMGKFQPVGSTLERAGVVAEWDGKERRTQDRAEELRERIKKLQREWIAEKSKVRRARFLTRLLHRMR